MLVSHADCLCIGAHLQGDTQVEEGRNQHVASNAAGVGVEEEQLVGARTPGEGRVARFPCLGFVWLLVVVVFGRLVVMGLAWVCCTSLYASGIECN